MTANPRIAVVFLVLAGAAGSAAAQDAASAKLASLSRDVACAPVLAERAAGTLKIVAGRDMRKSLFAPGDVVTINGGSSQGMKNGDEFFVRRVTEDRYAAAVRGKFPATVQTAGAVQIREAHGDAAVAVVTYACDGIMEGDFLERFEPAALPTDSPGTTPDFAHPGRLILAADRKSISGPGEFMIVDRGSDHGVRVGQRLTIFRTTLATGGPVTQVGAARVYAVSPENATLRIESSVDAVHVGDLVAIHR